MMEPIQFLASPADFAPMFLGVVVTFIVLEFVATRLAHIDSHDTKETAASFAIAIGNKVIRTLEASFVAVPFLMAYNYRLFEINLASPLAWIALFLLVEFVYYWHHRASHTVRWLWATHAVHHSPTRFNLTAGIRLGWTGAISGHFLFYIPLALIGFHPLAIATVLGANLAYQFFIHSELVPRLGPLEWILNTPTHHKVHHACNDACLDKNYGGTLIIFDRLFGTFAAPPKDAPLRYGLAGRAQTNNPIKIVFGEWIEMIRDIKNSRSGWRARLSLILGPPRAQTTSSAHRPKSKEPDINVIRST